MKRYCNEILPMLRNCQNLVKFVYRIISDFSSIFAKISKKPKWYDTVMKFYRYSVKFGYRTILFLNWEKHFCRCLKISQPKQAVDGHSWQVCFHLVNMTYHLVFFQKLWQNLLHCIEPSEVERDNFQNKKNLPMHLRMQNTLGRNWVTFDGINESWPNLLSVQDKSCIVGLVNPKTLDEVVIKHFNIEYKIVHTFYLMQLFHWRFFVH